MFVITEQFSQISQLADASLAVRQVLDACTDASIELALVILPRCIFSRLEMDDLLRLIRQDGVPLPLDQSELAFALAAFHPDAAPDTSQAERFIPYLRRSPDPMVQAVRSSVLRKIDPARGAGTSYFDLETMNLASLSTPPPEPQRTRIARANLATCQKRGLDEIENSYLSIMTDHRATRERLRRSGM
jgi:hypothetical protein